MPTPTRIKYSERDANEIERYLRERDIPDWFRGISKFQCAATNSLFEALLYDGEQHSTHRVRACLTALGLKPAISKEQLKKLMKISRGSDLAFLWFLLESHYKSKGPGYSINEQILYSCIAHLDMVTTLRELDRLLPQNRNPKGKIKPKKKQRQIVIKPQKFTQFQLTRYSYSPYLEEIITPLIQYPSFSSKRPYKKVVLDEYEKYKDPKHIVRNEANRWFANYVPKVSRRIVSRILRDEIARILDKSDEISREFDNKLVLCEHHKCLMDVEAKRKQVRELERRVEMKKYFDVDGRRDRSTTDRIMAQIERDVNMYMQKSRYDAERIHPHQNYKKQKIEVLEGIDTIRYCEPYNAEDDECHEREMEEEDDDKLSQQSKSDDYKGISNGDGMCPKMVSFCDMLRRSKDYDCLFRALCEPTARHKSEFADGDQFFFIGNQEHQPWHFDYQKIFTVEHSAPTQEQSIKLSFVKALNSDMSLIPDIHGNVNVDKIVDLEVKKQWSESVDEYNRRVHIEPPPAIKKPVDEEIPIRFDREYFDPNDKKYMVYMLKCCFDRMKTNGKFVLASMPNAHKLPSLLYFIQDRYGKRYSFEERQCVFAESLRILRALEKLSKTAPSPKIEEFATATKVSYACRDYLQTKGDKIRQKYYDQLDQIVMNEARIYWFSMRPYLLTSGPPRNTYFAYMPPRTVDLTRFRQWKPSEFVDAKKSWERRRREAKRY